MFTGNNAASHSTNVQRIFDSVRGLLCKWVCDMPVDGEFLAMWRRFFSSSRVANALARETNREQSYRKRTDLAPAHMELDSSAHVLHQYQSIKQSPKQQYSLRSTIINIWMGTRLVRWSAWNRFNIEWNWGECFAMNVSGESASGRRFSYVKRAESYSPRRICVLCACRMLYISPAFPDRLDTTEHKANGS